MLDLLAICEMIHLGDAVGAGLETHGPRQMPPAIYQMVHGHRINSQPPVVTIRRPHASQETLEEAMKRYGNRI